MTGTIVTRVMKDGTKRYNVVYRANGKQRWKTFKKQKDAARFLTSTVKKVQDGTWTEVTPTLMTDVLDKWLSDSVGVRLLLGELKPSTAKSYKSMVEVHLKPAFGEIRSDHLRAAAIAEWRKTLAERVGSGTLAPKTFNNLLNLLHAILTWARHEAQSYLAHDPLVGQKRLKRERIERDFLEPADIAALLKAATSPLDLAVLYVAIYAGLRRGEIFGLTWTDIDFGEGKHGGRLHVRRSVYQGDVTRPKTVNSERRVDVPNGVLDALQRHRDKNPGEDDAFIFRTSEGTPIDSDNYSKRVFAEIRKAAKLRSFGLHTLRHTYASLLIAQGESLKYISRQLGHGSIQITADTYGHLFKETSTQAMRRLDRLIPASSKRPKSKNNKPRRARHIQLVAGAA